ncbi:MAG: Sulfate/thiosulfate import ATP-binding protein CysA [Myxococcales bacterium]|nr:Sulfate/thiosulfate import ATP-binding protein CysA [Myxococcales bacterium]
MSIEIRVEQISKAFGEYPALDDVSVTIPAGELVALLGPSGSGKTTLLRVIAGIDTPDRGRVRFGSVDVTESAIQDRKVGFVFQDYALFDHMTVADNIGFGLSVRNTDRTQIATRVRDLLARIQLAGLGDRYPRQLSGGQRQRVALARALAPGPQVLLLDEPFGALDARVRTELRTWLRRLHDDLHVTSVFVTHDQEEALEVADRIVVMNVGKIEQVGTPNEVFDVPASAFVMDFLGGVNVLSGTVHGETGTFGTITLPWAGGREGAARAYVRGHDLLLRRTGIGGPSLPVVVAHVRRVGVAAHVLVTSSEHGDLSVELPFHELAEHGIERGAELVAHVRSARIFAETR